ncbi:hypothetical protein J6590_069562, partial [Homalodisca vitripennis]
KMAVKCERRVLKRRRGNNLQIVTRADWRTGQAIRLPDYRKEPHLSVMEPL